MIDLQYYTEYFWELPILIKVVWLISGVLFVVILALIAYLKFLRSHLRENEKTLKKYQKEYEENLINYLYAGDNENEISEAQRVLINKMKICVADKFKRKILISVMSKLINDISGEMAHSIQKFYFETGLVNYALYKLKGRKWDVIASGIKELTQFEVKEAHNEIIKYVKHPNLEVRNEAQLYLVSLFQFKGLVFLDKLKTSLSEWAQIQLLEILQKFDNQEIPNIRPWLQSKNNSVVQFSLKLVKIYNQFDVRDILLELLSHENKEIRVDTIQVLNYFQDTECKHFLKTKFNTSSEEEQIEFFRLLEITADTDDEVFILENVAHTNFKIKLAALKILKAINLEIFNEVKLETTDLQVVEIVKFIEAN
ncbi:hypothetical protein [Lutibacter sp.]|uniref:hypothetical protein n=1 Tax=Lutibacter sp. TaxID=1925666 RepID=UPI0035656098